MIPTKIPDQASLVRAVESQLASLRRDGDTGQILCAFSGGADSAVLLSVLWHLSARLGLRIRAMHVHHGIRGEEADRDEAFCRSFCAERGIPYLVSRVDVPQEAEMTGRGIEETARELRYRELERMRDESELIATAHNATDNAETMLFHLIRGSGLAGMAGIPPRRDALIRPLLSCTREEVRAFADLAGIPYMEDSTNADAGYARNRIRLHILPEIAAINPSYARTMYRNAEMIRTDAVFLDELARAERNAFRYDADSRVGYPLERYRVLDPAVGSRVFLLLYETAGPAVPTECGIAALQTSHLSALARLAHAAVPHTGLDLPSGIRAEIENGSLWMFRSGGRAGAPPSPFRYSLIPGINRFPELDYTVYLRMPGDPEPEFPGTRSARIPSARILPETIQGSLFIRSRESGDAYRAFGITKTVRRRMSEKQIPLAERQWIPVFCDAIGPVWIPGFPVADRVTADPGSEDAAVLYYCPFQV